MTTDSLAIVHQIRLRRSEHGTEGIVMTPGGFRCNSFELPWRDNQANYSCIPPGEYLVTLRKSPRYGLIYWLMDVEHRPWILTHWGNFAGDRTKGLKTDTYGCLLYGKYFGWLSGQRAVLVSRTTVRQFMEHMAGDDFKLKIHESFKGV